MNPKKRALNSIIKALRRNKKRYIAIAFEGNQVLLTDSHAALIIPLEDINAKDKERIEKLFYSINVFNDKDHDHVIKHGGHCQLLDKRLYEFIHDKFIKDQDYTSEGLSFYEEVEGGILLGYKLDNVSVYMDQLYKDLIHNPMTIKQYNPEGKLRVTKQFKSNIENSIAIVLPYVYNIEKERK